MGTAVDWDRIVVAWGTRRGPDGQRDHTALAAETPRPSAPETPVPRCDCARCETYRAGGDREDADVAAWLVRRLALETRPEDRRERAESAVAAWADVGAVLPAPDVLVEISGGVPGALPPRGDEGDDDRDPLPVDEARRVPVRDVAARLGLGEPVGRWGEPRVLCPLHDDHDPSLRLAESEGVWYCDVCAVGGDGIELVRRALGVGFADAVRWIVDGVGAAPRSRDPAQESLARGRSP